MKLKATRFHYVKLNREFVPRKLRAIKRHPLDEFEIKRGPRAKGV